MMTQKDFFNQLIKFRNKKRVTKREIKEAVSLLYSALDSGILRIETAKKLCWSACYPIFHQAPSYVILWQAEQDRKAGKTVYGIC